MPELLKCVECTRVLLRVWLVDGRSPKGLAMYMGGALEGVATWMGGALRGWSCGWEESLRG